jgi:hypothetical protein
MNAHKERLLSGVYKYLKSKDFKDFSSILKELDPPKKIVEKQNDEVFTPDLTATHKGTLCLFDLVLDKLSGENQNKLIKRWEVINNHAQSTNSKYYIIINVDQFDLLMALINKHNLENIGILQFESN